jgi:hypothetical protein
MKMQRGSYVEITNKKVNGHVWLAATHSVGNTAVCRLNYSGSVHCLV